MASTSSTNDKHTALILPGGGAKCRVQAGMLHALYDSGLKYDSIRGVSGGGLNAAVYHQGDLDEMTDLWMTVKDSDVFRDAPWRMIGRDAHMKDTAPLANLIKRYVDPSRICEREEPLTIYAWDSNYLQSVPFELGKLLPDDARAALLATSALPVLFPPVYMRGRRLTDGGVGRNFPISDAIEEGADRIVVLVPSSPAVPEYGNAKETFESLLESFGEAQLQEELESIAIAQEHEPELEVIIVRPRPGQDCGGLLEFSMPAVRRHELMAMGYELARDALKKASLWQIKVASTH